MPFTGLSERHYRLCGLSWILVDRKFGREESVRISWPCTLNAAPYLAKLHPDGVKACNKNKKIQVRRSRS